MGWRGQQKSKLQRAGCAGNDANTASFRGKELPPVHCLPVLLPILPLQYASRPCHLAYRSAFLPLKHQKKEKRGPT